MEKITTAIFITITLITIIPNSIFCYKYFISKEFDSIGDGGFVHFMALWMFFWLGCIKLTMLIYNYL